MRKKDYMINNKTFYVIIGTRAQLVKMASVMKELQDRGIEYNYVYVGQHKETIDDLRKCFGLKYPDVDLSIKRFEASNMLKFIIWFLKMLGYLFMPSRVLRNGKGIVLTHGDPVTCVWGAILGKLHGSKVAHIESGLRSFNIFNPFPEELNRIITFYFADYYFCPNQTAVNNLKKHKGVKINMDNNTLIDAVRLALASDIEPPLDLKGKYFVFSMHRFENVYNKKRFEQGIELAKKASEKMPCVFVLHPVTRERLLELKIWDELENNKNIILTPRFDFVEFIKLIKNSEFFITDGGGNQEECFHMGHPCLIFRKETEWPDLVGGNVVLSKYDEKTIDEFLNNYQKYKIDKKLPENYPSKIVVDFLTSI